MHIQKTFKKSNTSFLRCAALLTFTITLLSSCLKTNDVSITRPAALLIINATPYADSSYVYFDGALLDTGAVRFAKTLGYFQINTANHEIIIFKGDRTISRGSGSFERGKYFSLFVTRTADTTILVATDDDVAKPQVGKAKIRFMNLSYDAPEISATFDNGTAVAIKTAFKAASPFVELNPGTYKLDLRDASSTQTSKYLMNGIRVESGKIYTIWSYGLWNGTTSKNKFNININENI
ncbi:MAG: DUF4397 domain-containing protein [Sphingobacteriaceae bacterium]